MKLVTHAMLYKSLACFEAIKTVLQGFQRRKNISPTIYTETITYVLTGAGATRKRDNIQKSCS